MPTGKEEQFRVSALSFDEVKESLKEYLRGQDKFTDYDFEGSAINILLDVLALNTHYSGFYNNMTASEMFLDSSNLRGSAVSIAKQLGYQPRSVTSAHAKIKVSITSGQIARENDPVYTIKEYTTFKTSLNNTNYTFCNINNIIAYPSSYNDDGDITSYDTDEFFIYEGKPKTTSFIHDGYNKEQRFVIENTLIDTTTMRVYIKESLDTSDNDKVLWTRIQNITEVDSLSTQYSLEETSDGFYELRFGDGVIGKELSDGNVIEVTYLSSHGELLNGSGKSFTTSTGTVEVIDNAIGGGDRESIESIKFTAPKVFATQERAVTLEDYKALVLRDFPIVDTVEAWGGEENDPPAFGKVFLCIKPKQGTKLSTPEKLAIIKNITLGRNVVGITPEIVDPNIFYILVDAEVWWKTNKSSLTAGELLSTIRNEILDYRQSSIVDKGFEGMFYEVDIASQIKELDPSITAVIIKTKIQKRISLSEIGILGTKIEFHEPFYHPHDGHESIMTSNEFQHKNATDVKITNCQLYDDGRGNIGIQYLDGTATKYFTFTVGTINYTTGCISLNKKFKPLSVANKLDLKITVTPDTNNFCPHQNTLLEIDTLDVDSITVKLDES